MPEENIASPVSDKFSEIVSTLKEANNVLVTVRRDPGVDHLAACIGLTLALNKMGKHASAVFSGEVPSTIQFLEPNNTIETNTDSLRDFIISLDKSKADKLRYKVEDEVVKIFITPYKTSISDKDLEFSQGDFNVDAVVAIGVHDRGELDEAIVQHGRILHDATVMAINVQPGPELGSINWTDEGSSSLSEMVSDVVTALQDDILDEQIATAFLTGIVVETDRFRNERANPHTMSVSGTLMAAGASTQLVATKLEETPEPSDEIPSLDDNDTPNDDGTISIEHDVSESIRNFENQADETIINNDEIADILDKVHEAQEQQQEVAQQDSEALDDALKQYEAPEPTDDNDQVSAGEQAQADAPNSAEESERHAPSLVLQPPSLGGQLTANSVPEHQQYSSEAVDPMSAAAPRPSIMHRQTVVQPDRGDQTLSDLEKAVNSPHLDQQSSVVEQPPVQEITETTPVPDQPAIAPPPPTPDYAREAVERAVTSSQDYKPEPLQSVGSAPLGLNIQGAEFVDPVDNNSQNNTTPPPPVPPPLPPQ